MTGSRVTAIHAGDREAILTAISEQAAELHEGDVPFVTCPCGARVPLDRSFRCYYCEVFFCPVCAEDHFGDLDDAGGVWKAIDDLGGRVTALEHRTAAAEPEGRRRGWGDKD